MHRSARRDIRHRYHGRRAARASFGLESLECRQFLSASPCGFHHGGGPGGGHFGGPSGDGGMGPGTSAITFSLVPSAVLTGLDTLATNAGLSDPTSDQTVSLGNVDGIETYTVTINGTGTATRLTVDAGGNPVTAPTRSTSTWSTLGGTDTGSNSAAAAEISAIATALGLTAPTSDTAVNVTTTSAGATTYSVTLAPSTTSTSGHRHGGRGVAITVDSNGNPAGNQTLPFSVIPASIQSAIIANVPSGATALATNSTQSVRVETIDGVTLYSTTFTSTGTATTVTVNAAGQLTSLPTHSTTTFSALTSTVQNELQAIATAKGVITTLASDQSVDVLTEPDGTVLYSVTVAASVTTASGSSVTRNVTVTVDPNGNPTTLPTGDFGRGFGGPGCDAGSTPSSTSGSGTSPSTIATTCTSTLTSTVTTASSAKASAKKASSKVAKKLAAAKSAMKRAVQALKTKKAIA